MGTFDYDGIRIHYLRRGSGRPLLLLHGFAASTYSWRYVVEALHGDYEIFAIDLKGFGLSGKPRDNRYSAKDQSDMVMAFVAHHHLKDITLFGHSFGGGVALFSYLKGIDHGRDLISRMVLLSSASYPQRLPPFMSALKIPVLNRILLRAAPPGIATRVLLKRMFCDGSKVTDEMVAAYAGYTRLPGAHRSLIATVRQIIPPDIETVTSRYKEIDIPVLLVWGEKDRVVPLSIGQRLSREIPGARLRTIERCGHVPQEECPEETIAIVREFLDS